MIESLRLKNFTVFPDADFTFSNGLNVVVGENGSGKSHVLKAGYSILHPLALGTDPDAGTPTKSSLQTSFADKLQGVFRPDQLGRLVRRQQGRNRCEVTCTLGVKNRLAFSFNSTSKEKVTVDKAPSSWTDKLPAFLPTRELLTIYPGFVSLYETTHLPFEETYRDTCILLGAPLARGPREAAINALLAPLELAMGGKVETDSAGRFYLNADAGKFEMHLVAEGLRKLAMIARLIATGQLVESGCLFWDEPEANLNPRIVKLIARTILELCKGGIQVFIATHSLFLMRELDILARDESFKDVPTRYFGLHPSADGVTVSQGDTVDDIGDIASLDEDLSQSDRYLETN